MKKNLSLSLTLIFILSFQFCYASHAGDGIVFIFEILYGFIVLLSIIAFFKKNKAFKLIMGIFNLCIGIMVTMAIPIIGLIIIGAGFLLIKKGY